MTESGQGPKKSLPMFKKAQQVSQPRNTLKSLFILSCLASGVFFTIYKGMSWLAHDDLTVTELYSRSLDGRSDSRRFAAVEWARKLQIRRSGGRDFTMYVPNLVQQEQLCRVLNELSRSETHPMKNDEVYHGALANVLGFSAIQKTAQDCLVKLILSEWPSEQFLIQAQLAIGSMEDVALNRDWAEFSRNLLQDSRPSIRKATVFALGARLILPSDKKAFLPDLERLLFDENLDVRWNSALVVGSFGSLRALELYRGLLIWVSGIEASGEYSGDLKQWPPALSEIHLSFLEKAFRQIDHLGPEEMQDEIRNIADEHPQLKIRLAAKNAIAKS